MEECLLNALNRLDTAPVPATIADVPAYGGLPDLTPKLVSLASRVRLLIQ